MKELEENMWRLSVAEVLISTGNFFSAVLLRLLVLELASSTECRDF